MTNSKEALDNLVHCKSITRCKECRHKSLCTMERDFNIIKQDLDRLEKLEKENQELRKAIKQWNINGGNLLRENIKLKQALEKACERLDYTCPVEEELVEDLDCDYCDNNYKECWKKYFMKEALGNVKD